MTLDLCNLVLHSLSLNSDNNVYLYYTALSWQINHNQCNHQAETSVGYYPHSTDPAAGSNAISHRSGHRHYNDGGAIFWFNGVIGTLTSNTFTSNTAQRMGN
eukprot:837668_1